jgi:S4 domain.
MAGVGKQREEFVLISDALAFIEARTGFAFERRQFLRYVEAGLVRINGQQILINSFQIGSRWFLTRESIDGITHVLISK